MVLSDTTIRSEIEAGRIVIDPFDEGLVQPSSIDAFNNAAVNAIRGSNPTQSLPPEYPDENALFTVTFYYNETPP